MKSFTAKKLNEMLDFAKTETSARSYYRNRKEYYADTLDYLNWETMEKIFDFAEAYKNGVLDILRQKEEEE
jgi:hypothetical protein